MQEAAWQVVMILLARSWWSPGGRAALFFKRDSIININDNTHTMRSRFYFK